MGWESGWIGVAGALHKGKVSCKRRVQGGENTMGLRASRVIWIRAHLERGRGASGVMRQPVAQGSLQEVTSVDWGQVDPQQGEGQPRKRWG